MSELAWTHEEKVGFLADMIWLVEYGCLVRNGQAIRYDDPRRDALYDECKQRATERISRRLEVSV